MCPFIWFKPVFFIVSRYDNNLIVIIQTYTTNMQDVLITIHNWKDTLTISFIFLINVAIKINVTTCGVVRQNLNNLSLCSLFKCCILL